MDTLERALPLHRAAPYPYAEPDHSYINGVMHQQKGEPEQTRERLVAALSILRRSGERF